MLDKKITNSKVDSIPVNKSKDYLWRYIKDQTLDKKAAKGPGFFARLFGSINIVPKKFAYSGVVATVVLIAVIFGINFSWVGVQTVHASFEMSADKEAGDGVEADSNFILKASENLSTETIKEYLKISPEVDFDVKKISEGEYEIDPAKDLEGNSVYNFTISSSEGDFSWAYQIKDVFKISGTLPADTFAGIPTDSGIEINFSHENFNFDDADKYFSISPAVKGRFEHHQRILSFIPEGGLKEATLYTVTFKSGLELKDTDQKINEDYVFQFETESTSTLARSTVNFQQDYYEVKPGNTVALDIYSSDYYSEDALKPTLDVEVYKYKNVDEYQKALKGRFALPEWTSYVRDAHKYDTNSLTKVGTFEALLSSINWRQYIYIPDKDFGAGYYLFQFEDNGRYEQTLVQITDVSAYSNITITDSLIWANDLSSGKALDGATVELSDGKSYKTDSNGLVKFTTPDRWKQEYKSSSYDYIKIKSQDGKTLITQVHPYNSDYQSYKYWLTFNTDRPIYKPKDTVKFWGVMKAKSADTKVKNVSLKVEYSWNKFLKEIPLTVDASNTFSGELDINNYSPGYYTVYLQNDGEVIKSYSFQIEDYIKPAYNLSIESDKKAVFAGDEINFDISSKFFDGTPFPGLDVNYSYDNQKSTIKTDDEGNVRVPVKTTKQICTEYCYDENSLYFEANATLSEETNVWSSSYVRVFNSHLNLSSLGGSENGKATVDINTNWINIDKLNDETEIAYNDHIGEKASGRSVNGEIKEITWDKIEDGEHYDFINKKVVKDYRYEKRETNLGGFNVKTNKTGEAKYSFDIKEDKFYQVNLTAEDDQGNVAHSSSYIYGNKGRSNDYDYYNIHLVNANDDDQFDIGDKVEAVFSNDEVAVEDDGKFLFMQFNAGLKEYKVENSSQYQFQFGKEDVPNMYLSGVWFNGEKYEATGLKWVNYKRDLKKLNIEITTDKNSYNPGDEVKLDVKVTDIDGAGVAADVNLNLVDEAYYKVIYDNFNDPLYELYSDNISGVLESHDSHESPLSAKSEDGGLGGCFTGKTKILMADGSTKQIKDIKKGDMILTRKHPYSSELVAAEVLNTVSHFVSEYYVINENLEATGVHTVFVNGKWDVVSNVKMGDVMLGKNGEEIRVNGIRKVEEPIWVYNFEVKDQHTYFADGYYVHNEKGGDNIRDDFEDTALFDQIKTGSNGKGSISFKLPDNITSWRVTAKAIDTTNIQAGANVANIKVTLGFFADLIMNREYSVKDSPILKVRAFGDNLSKGDKVNFDINKIVSAVGQAFEGSYLKMPKFKEGKYDIVLSAESGGMKDALSKPVEIRGSRLKEDVTEFVRTVDSKTNFKLAKDGATEITLVDGGIGFYYQNVLNLYYTDGERLDQKLSRLAAADLLNKYFAQGNNLVEEDIMGNYQKNGLKLLPYGDEDLRLTALVLYAETNPGRYDKNHLKDYFYDIYQNVDSNFEDVILSLLGLASIDEPVLLSLREIQHEKSLTLEEKLYIALAFETLGSKNEAMAIYNDLFNKLATDNESAYATALGAMLASGLGQDEAATLFRDFAAISGIKDDIINLYDIAYVKNSLAHSRPMNAKVRVKVNNHTEEKELGIWDSYGIVAYNGDEVSVSVDEGDVAAITYYTKPIEVADYKSNDNLSLNRKYFVDGKETNNFKEGDLVEVVLTANIKSNNNFDNYMITDILPSGLTPVSEVRVFGPYFYIDSYYPGNDRTVKNPYRVNRQEVYFNVFGFKGENGAIEYPQVKYFARVVNPGEFYAEPAKVQSYLDMKFSGLSEEDTVKIEKAK